MNSAVWLLLLGSTPAPEAAISQIDAFAVVESEALAIGAVEWQALDIGAAVSQSLPGGTHEYEVGP